MGLLATLKELMGRPIRDKFRSSVSTYRGDRLLMALLGKVLSQPGLAERAYGEGEVFLIKGGLFLSGVRLERSAYEGVGTVWKEDLGFCDKGQGGRTVERAETQIGGRIPVNPSGGLLTKGHPLGATGIAQLIELFWQLREEVASSGGLGDPQVNAQRQVAIRKGYALQHNVGGTGISNSVVTILSRNP